jgi:hypothetical protein
VLRVESEDERREAQAARAQDVARASGHGVVRLTCLLAVTVTGYEELETTCAEEAQPCGAGRAERRARSARRGRYGRRAMMPPYGHCSWRSSSGKIRKSPNPESAREADHSATDR